VRRARAAAADRPGDNAARTARDENAIALGGRAGAERYCC